MAFDLIARATPVAVATNRSSIPKRWKSIPTFQAPVCGGDGGYMSDERGAGTLRRKLAVLIQ
jgi:hypothetical protein